ncbi:MAG: DUF6596 domain-containing protein [Pseudomonadota bacterium]
MSSAAVEIARARPRVVAALAAHLRDLDSAEDAFAEAVEACLRLEELPESIPAWLLTVAKRKAVDAIRKRDAQARAADGAAIVSDMADIIQLPEAIPDERLRLIFICCHPALAPEARAALAMKVICGLPVSAIARVFVTSEATMFQRITRAKTKIRDAGIDFELPPRKAWGERLGAVLLTLELAYTVAYQDAGGELDEELSGEVARLAKMVAELLPNEPEALGLAALVALARSREAARVDAEGAMVPLSRQDTALWDHAAIEQARKWLDQAAAMGRTGPYQIMASIQLTHARRAFDGKVDWCAILTLYDALLVLRPSAIVSLNRTLAVAQVEGFGAALAELEVLPIDRLKSARPYHAARAELLIQSGDVAGARSALDAALELDPPRVEKLFLERKLRELAAL